MWQAGVLNIRKNTLSIILYYLYIYMCIYIYMYIYIFNIYIYVPISKNQLRPLHRQAHWRQAFPHRQDSRPLEDGDFLNIDVTARDGPRGQRGQRVPQELDNLGGSPILGKHPVIHIVWIHYNVNLFHGNDMFKESRSSLYIIIYI